MRKYSFTLNMHKTSVLLSILISKELFPQIASWNLKERISDFVFDMKHAVFRASFTYTSIVLGKKSHIAICY